MQEPYEQQGKWLIIMGFVVFVLGWYFGGIVVGFLSGMLVVGIATWWPMFMDSCRWRSAGKLTIEGYGTFSLLSFSILNTTADDSKTKMPGTALIAFGGGGPRYGWSWRDGGRAYASGGFIRVPIDSIIRLAPNHWYLPVIPHIVEKENYPVHWLATVEEQKFSQKYSTFLSARFSVQALTAPSEKMLNQEAIDTDKNRLVSQMRDMMADFHGQQATNLDALKRSLEIVQPTKRGLFKRAPQPEPQPEEPQNGD